MNYCGLGDEVDLKKLLYLKLLGAYVNQTVAPSIAYEYEAELAPATLEYETFTDQPTLHNNEFYDVLSTSLSSSLIPSSSPTSMPTLPTFAPAGMLNSYILVSPHGINQLQNLTFIEQETIRIAPMLSTAELSYAYVEADDRVANKLIGEKFTSKSLPLLRDIASDKLNFCRVKISGYLIMAIASLQSASVIATSSGVGLTAAEFDGIQHMYPMEGTISAAENSPVRLFDLTNPGFFGSELLLYSYDGNIGNFAAQSTLENFDVVAAFTEVLRLGKMRQPMKLGIVYTGEQSDALISQLISSVKKMAPVFTNLDEALMRIRQHYFKTTNPELTLDATGCPIGQQSKIAKLKLHPYKCSQKFPIHGISTEGNDYGFKFTVKFTNRWFALKISALRNNGNLAEFKMTFTRDGLVVQADQHDKDIISAVDLRYTNDGKNTTLPRTISFAYKQFIDAGEYDIKIKSEDLKFGLNTDAATVAIRKKGQTKFSHIGTIGVHGQLRFAEFCGFSPVGDNKGVKDARTLVTDITSRFINTGLNSIPERRRLRKVKIQAS